MSGLTLGNADTLLTRRAADYLAAGPADPQALISHVCQLPGAPRNIAEHMAAALFAGHQRFVRESDGRWNLREQAQINAVILTRNEVEGKDPLERRRNSSALRGPSVAALPQDDIRTQPFVVVDVETTGSRAYGGDRVTEVAVVQVKNGIATTVFDSLVNPDRPIPPAVMALTNITWEMVKHAPRFREICPQLLGVLEGHVFVAHNANFDWRFLSAEIERVTSRPLQGRRLCTVRLARRLLPQIRRRNLDSLQNFYGVENYARHRAGGDAVATAKIFLRLLDAARDRGCTTLDELDAVASRGSSRKKRKRRPPALPQSARGDESA